MTSPYQRKAARDLDIAHWRKSSYNGDQGSCVEIALLPDSRIATRNSNHPQAGVLFLARAEMNAWIANVKTGSFDDFA